MGNPIKKEVIIGDCRLLLGDCLSIMPTLGKVDAVVTDPPYGINENNARNLSRERLAPSSDYGHFDWDAGTADEAVQKAIECGQWAVIFGGNYYDLPPTSCYLVWDKLNGASDFADCELAWTNLPKAVRRLKFLWNGCMRKERDVKRQHPTQKPIGVMKWCIEHLPKDSKTILDPFMGSGTTGVACVQLQRKFIGIELDESYFDIACKRIEEAYKQPSLFPVEKPKPAKTGDLFGA